MSTHMVIVLSLCRNELSLRVPRDSWVMGEMPKLSMTTSRCLDWPTSSHRKVRVIAFAQRSSKSSTFEPAQRAFSMGMYFVLGTRRGLGAGALTRPIGAKTSHLSG